MNPVNALRIFPVILSSLLFFCTSAAAQEAPSSPLKASVSYTSDLYGNLSGGQERGWAFMDNIDVELNIDLSQQFPSLRGTSLYVYGIGNQGGSISELAGDLQGVSNIETENSWRLYEVWIQKKALVANSSILVGLYDVNSEFNVLNSSALFLNSSHGIDPSLALSGTLGPSIFPYTSLAARFKVNPYKGMILQAAIMDGVPSDPGSTRGTKIRFRKDDGIFMIAEIGLHSIAKGEYRNRNARLRNLLSPGVVSDNSLSIGGWYYTKKKAHWDPALNSENEYGFYISGEYEWAAGKGPAGTGIKVFSRAGIANENTSTVHAFLGGGMVFSGLLPERKADKTGISFAHARAGDPYLEQRLIDGSRPEKAETNFELTHLLVLNHQVKLQGDLQYILNPGLNRNLNSALVIGARFILSL